MVQTNCSISATISTLLFKDAD